MANDSLQNIKESVKGMNFIFDKVAGQVEDSNKQLALLVKQWGPLMTKEELNGAIAEFKKSKPEYEELEKLSGPMVNMSNMLSKLPPELAKLDEGKKVQEETAHLIEKNLPRAQLTNSGQAALAQLTVDEGNGQDTVLGRLNDLAGNFSNGKEFLASMATASLNASVGKLVAGLGANDTRAVDSVIAGLRKQGRLFGLDKNSLDGIVNSLQQARAATTPQAASAALSQLDDHLKSAQGSGTFSSTSGLGQAFRTAGVALGAVGAYGSIDAAVKDPNFENVVGALTASAGLGVDSVQLVAGITPQRRAARQHRALDCQQRRRWRRRGALGVPGSEVGQQRRLRLGRHLRRICRRLDRPARRWSMDRPGRRRGSRRRRRALPTGSGARLERAGKQVHRSVLARRWRRQPGYHPRFAQRRRRRPQRRAGVDRAGSEDGHSSDADAQLGADLSPDHALEFVEKMHGVDPDKEGKFPDTAGNDKWVTGGPANNRGPDTSPHSLEGLKKWLEGKGYHPETYLGEGNR